MAKNPREILNEVNSGIEALSEADHKHMQPWEDFGRTALKAGAIDEKNKRLICAALSLAARCDYCIATHVEGALKAGATREELIETIFLTGLMTGGPAMGYGATLFLDSIKTFAADFGK